LENGYLDALSARFFRELAPQRVLEYLPKRLLALPGKPLCGRE
jgi:hypothetical protein